MPVRVYFLHHFFFLFYQFLHAVVFDGLLLEGVGAPLFPLAGVWVVAALEGLGVYIFRGFYIGTAVGADIAELSPDSYRDAHFYLVFGDVPVFFEVGVFEYFLDYI